MRCCGLEGVRISSVRRSLCDTTTALTAAPTTGTAAPQAGGLCAGALPDSLRDRK